MDGVSAAPETSPPASNNYNSNNNNLLSAFVALLCGTICKDNMVDMVPAPAQENVLTEPLRETKTVGFSKDVCRSMIAMLDTDRTGKLNFEEFKRLWTSIRVWKNVFQKFDKNQSGSLSGFELREALTSAGYTLNNHTLNILMQRYGNKNAEIEFDDFIMCAIKLKIMIELFKDVASPKTNNATFSLEEWVQYTLYS